ncbi:type IV secretory system conjugative DNA transfer family protein [Flavobacterium columnare]|uniref:type IV secretory system conjugative DNA transfer family protein n=1 Tax=Flavobacterium columnare TaxID=996 RepID=UPI0013FDB30C|nr:type IV secretory system conjugative DNA transfer family protein [Flavobacterium columnare]
MDKILYYVLIPSIMIGLLAGLLSEDSKKDEIFDCPIETTKGTRYIKNVLRGVLIFGSAGSGKTESPIYALLKHFSLKGYTGVTYDFKDGELTELMLPLFGERLRIIAIHKPYIGNRINPLDEKYIRDEKDINEVVNVIIDNLGGNSGGKTDFFVENASALLSAIILKFHLDHKEYCTIPHIISFILACDFSQESNSNNLSEQAIATFGKLKAFLLSNKRVSIQASAFIMGLASERQTASVLSTLANALRKLAFPEAFWVLSGNDIDLDVNNPENNVVISVLNEPKAESFLTPIIATIIHTATKQMMVRGRKQSFVLLDEAPTIKLRNMAKIPATMRSFKVATIYCAQDIVQGFVQYGRDNFKEITSNLSTQFFGKANDPDTAKFYEGYFELVKEKTKSINKKGSATDFFSTTNSTSISEREVAKVRANEFLKLKVGNFAFLSDGKSEIINFKRPIIKRLSLDSSKNLTDEMYISNFYKIIEEVQILLK